MPAQRDMFAEKTFLRPPLARFFVLLNLNIKIGTLLPLIDFSIEREKLVCLSQENIAFTSSFGQKIHSIKNIIFQRVKMNVWNELLDATTEPTQPPMDEYDKPDELIEITINRIQASSENLKKAQTYNNGFTCRHLVKCTKKCTHGMISIFEDLLLMYKIKANVAHSMLDLLAKVWRIMVSRIGLYFKVRARAS